MSRYPDETTRRFDQQFAETPSERNERLRRKRVTKAAGDDGFRTINGKMIFWKGHRCVGSDVHPGVRLIWTCCGKDVPADAAYLSEREDGLTCMECALALDEQISRHQGNALQASKLASCDCCGEMVPRDEIGRVIAYGIETFACARCCGEEPGEE